MSNINIASYIIDWRTLLVLFITTIIYIYMYLRNKLSYWKRVGFPFVEGTIPCGSITNFILAKRSLSQALKDLYDQAEGHKYIGYYSLWTPTLLIRDPELIKNITVTDFDHFMDRGVYYNEKDDPLSANLFSLDGMKWKTTRAKLSNMFSNTKIKFMYLTMKACALQLAKHIKESIDEGRSVIDFKELSAKHSINDFANTVVGVEGHALNEESQLYEKITKATAATVIQGFRFGLSILGKDFAKLVDLKLTSKDVEQYFLELTRNSVIDRSKSDVERKDFMHLLMQLWDKNTNYEYQMKPDNDISLSWRDMAAQTFIFLMAAYETTACTVCFALYELARNQEIQEKLLAEVDAAGSAEDITYEELSELNYMDMVLKETWRMYSPGGLIIRECKKDYKLPDGRVLEKGVTVTVPIMGLHADPEYFPDPEKFDPERFNKDSPSQKIRPYTYLAFGEGQRGCIGKRYGKTQTKITLFALLSKYRFEIVEETPTSIKIDPRLFVTQSEDAIHFRAICRK